MPAVKYRMVVDEKKSHTILIDISLNRHPFLYSLYSVRAGTANLEEGGRIYEVENIIDHHQNEYYVDYDLSIIKLKNSLELSDKVAIAKLSTLENDFEQGTVFNITGWGNTEHSREVTSAFMASREEVGYLMGRARGGGRWDLVLFALGHIIFVSNIVYQFGSSISKNLRRSEVPLVNRETCENYYEGILNHRMFCAGANGHDACQGDSGGPLSLNGEVVGVVSGGRFCGIKEFPTIYMKISEFQRWIKNTINDHL
ncbi:Trypsin-3 [Eumeta japonica]|uniref:Trypsin-3 n=1 Tax=Eumeta variegata TaxID=151549 RepID=A0A4C1ZLL9_EUMVA|nr:Trypsin-3 [Eumeta japonica]